MKQDMVMMVAVLCWAAANCLHTAELSLKNINNNKFQLDLKIGSRIERFRLVKKNAHVPTMLAQENGVIADLQSQADVVYEDTDQSASVIIEKDEKSVFRISGTLGADLVISPTGEKAEKKQCRNCERLVLHNVTTRNSETESPAAGRDDYQQVDSDYSISRQGKSLSDRRKVYPEILVVMDYQLFKIFGFSVSKARKYIVSYFNAVNMRYKTFTQPRIELNIAGIVLSKTKSSLPFISSNLKQTDMLDAPAALHAMGQYYYRDRWSSHSTDRAVLFSTENTFRANLPVYDMVVTLTGLDMARIKNGKMSRSNTGYAYVGGACVRNVYLKKISSVALVEDSGGYSGVIVAAHEIGHLLGAVHDGDAAPSYLRGPGAKSCPWSEGYIMSDRRYTARGQLWSDCSVKQMKHFLSTTTAQCLYNIPTNTDFSLPGQLSLPGSSLSLDQQCRADKGTRACYHDHRVCAQLFCYTNNFSGCYATRPAVEGSSCGQNRHCISGKCVHKSQSHNRRRTNSKESGRETKPQKKSKNRKTSLKTAKLAKLKISKYRSKTKASTKKTSLSREPKASSVEECRDSFALMGSLSCDQLFRRYAFNYCNRSKVVKQKCCKSYNKYCQ